MKSGHSELGTGSSHGLLLQGHNLSPLSTQTSGRWKFVPVVHTPSIRIFFCLYYWREKRRRVALGLSPQVPKARASLPVDGSCRTAQAKIARMKALLLLRGGNSPYHLSCVWLTKLEGKSAEWVSGGGGENGWWWWNGFGICMNVRNGMVSGMGNGMEQEEPAMLGLGWEGGVRVWRHIIIQVCPSHSPLIYFGGNQTHHNRGR